MPTGDMRREDAERAVRRGELKEALRLFRSLLAESPGDEGLRERITAIQSIALPRELGDPGAAEANAMRDLARPPTPEQTAEMLFGRGDLAGAIAAYQRIVRANPNHELARERLGELERLRGLAPESSGPATLPRKTPELLEALLARIASRRRA